MKYFKNRSVVGNHYYKIFDNGNVLHINHMNDGHYLINMIDDDDMDIMKHPEKYNVFDFEPEKICESTKEEFETAIKEAIFELGLYEYVVSK
jgi:hypothetical protein